MRPDLGGFHELVATMHACKHSGASVSTDKRHTIFPRPNLPVKSHITTPHICICNLNSTPSYLPVLSLATEIFPTDIFTGSFFYPFMRKYSTQYPFMRMLYPFMRRYPSLDHLCDFARFGHPFIPISHRILFRISTRPMQPPQKQRGETSSLLDLTPLIAGESHAE